MHLAPVASVAVCLCTPFQRNFTAYVADLRAYGTHTNQRRWARFGIDIVFGHLRAAWPLKKDGALHQPVRAAAHAPHDRRFRCGRKGLSRLCWALAGAFLLGETVVEYPILSPGIDSLSIQSSWLIFLFQEDLRLFSMAQRVNVSHPVPPW